MTYRAVYKSSSIEFLDGFYSTDPAAALRFGRDVLTDPVGGALAVASSWASEASFDATEIDGFQSVWLADDGPLGGHEVDRVIRLANREAIAIAGAHEPVVPIETFWVLGAGDDFEVHVHDGFDRVTVFMFVPLKRDYGSLRSSTSSWVIRVGDLEDVASAAPRRALDAESDPVLMIQVSGPLTDGRGTT